MKFLIIHNTASRGNYLPRPIRLPFFFSSCDESVPRLGGCSAPVGAERNSFSVSVVRHVFLGFITQL